MKNLNNYIQEGLKVNSKSKLNKVYKDSIATQILNTFCIPYKYWDDLINILNDWYDKYPYDRHGVWFEALTTDIEKAKKNLEMSDKISNKYKCYEFHIKEDLEPMFANEKNCKVLYKNENLDLKILLSKEYKAFMCAKYSWGNLYCIINVNLG